MMVRMRSRLRSAPAHPRTSRSGLVPWLVLCVAVTTVLAGVAAAGEVAVASRSGAAIGAIIAPVALALVPLSLAVVGAWLVHAQPRQVLGWPVLAVGVIVQAGVAGEISARAGWTPWGDTPVGLAIDFLGGMGLFLLLGLLPLLYPVFDLGRRVDRVAGLAVVAGAVGLQAQWLHGQLDPAHPWPLDAGPSDRGWWSWLPLGLLVGGVLVVWALGAARMLRAGHPERQQRAWLLVAVVAVILTQALGSSLLATTVQAIALWALPVAIAVGVLRYRALGIDTALPRFVTAGVLALVVTALYLVAAAIAELADVGTVGSVLVASLVVAALVVPLRDRLRVGVDRFLYGRQEVRERLRRDLHDGLGPSLTGLRLGLAALDDALAEGDTALASSITAVLRDEADRSVLEVRHILDGLRPAELGDVDLATALRRRVATTTAPTPVRVRVGDLPPLPEAVEDTIFRVVTEAVTNAHKHAEARGVMVAVEMDGPDRVVARVSDDGTGMADTAPRGIGLISMEARAADVGGRLDIDSSTAGTAVTLTLPLPERARR